MKHIEINRRGQHKMRKTTDKRAHKRAKTALEREHGVITVFVTLMMVPVVVITSLMVDAARIKLYSSQAIMAADSYGDAILSEYDNLLKELYGLFSVTQNEQGLEEIKKFSEYAGYSFDPTGGGKSLSGFMPYKNADVQLSYEPVSGASLSNNNVFQTQIGDFMKYRVIGQLADMPDFFSSISSMKTIESDRRVSELYTDISENSQEILELIGHYYEQLKILKDYPKYLDGRVSDFGAYSDALFDIVKSDEYAKYVNYKNNKSAIDAAVKKLERITNDSDSKEEWTAEDQELYDQYVDESEYKKSVDNAIFNIRRNAVDDSRGGTAINFDNVKRTIDALGVLSGQLEETLSNLHTQIEKLKGELDSCNEDMADNIRSEISDLEKIADMEHDFKETYELVAGNVSKNDDNKTRLHDQLGNLDKVRDRIKSGTMPVEKSDRGISGRNVSIDWLRGDELDHSLAWTDFMDTKSQFYNDLKQLCESGGDGTKGDKDKGDKEVKRANEKTEQYKKELEKDDAPAGLRSITPGLASQLRRNYDPGSEVPSVFDNFGSGISLEAFTKSATTAVDKFLVTMYDFGMFSSRVTNIQPAKDAETNGEDPDYKDKSLTKYDKSTDINYLYRAELEYIYGGHTDSKSNLNDVRNTICFIRSILNFTSSFTIDEVNSAINAIADAAASAVAATGVGAPAAPLVRVAVSGALRLAFAACETAADWKTLTEKRGVVTLLKTKIDQVESVNGLADLLNLDVQTKANKDKEAAFSYENYVFLLLLIFVGNNDMLDRTGDLVTLNVNQACNSGDALETLDFKISDTVTAVKTTCKVKMDFVVLPDNFAKMYLSGTDTEVMISNLEDTYLGYSIIRGY